MAYMAVLMFTEVGELTLTLRGAAEDQILKAVRRWPHWLRAEIKRDLLDPSRCLAVTLVTERSNEDTVRFILERSFGLRFPNDGGTSIFKPLPPQVKKKRKF
jgi:hypothetical protein